MSNTTHRSYPKPVPENFVSDDVVLLQQALDAVDGDIHLLFAAIAGLAPINHEHVIADVQGLSAALADKSDAGHSHTLEALSDVGGTIAAPAGSLLVKLVDGTWGPASPASVVGLHEHVIEDVVNLQAALDGLTSAAQVNAATNAALSDTDEVGARKASNGTWIKRTLVQFAGEIVKRMGPRIQADTVYKANPVDADMGVLADSAASWQAKGFTLANLWANYLKAKADALYLAVANIATAAEYRSKTADKVLTADKVWAAASPVNLGGALSGNLALNFASFYQAYGTLAANITFNTATGLTAGQSGVIVLINPGSFTLALNTATFLSSGAISLATGKNDISYYVDQDLKVHVMLAGKGMA